VKTALAFGLLGVAGTSRQESLDAVDFTVSDVIFPPNRRLPPARWATFGAHSSNCSK
jgi:hypothetical protein